MAGFFNTKTKGSRHLQGDVLVYNVRIPVLGSGLWGMTTVIQQKGLPKDYFLHKGDSNLVVGETPSDPTTLFSFVLQGIPSSSHFLSAWI